MVAEKKGAKDTYGLLTEDTYYRRAIDSNDTSNNVSNVLRYEMSCHLLTVTFMMFVTLEICITVGSISFFLINPNCGCKG